MMPTEELLRLVAKEDTAIARALRDLDLQLPVAIRRMIPSGSVGAPHPNIAKVAAAGELGQRTNETGVIVPALLRELNKLRPTDVLSGDYVRAILNHGSVASTAVPWLLAAEWCAITNGGGGGASHRGSSIGIPEIYRATAMAHSDPRQYFHFVTNQLALLAFPRNNGSSVALAEVVAMESQPAFHYRVWGLTDALRIIPLPLHERTDFLLRLDESPSFLVREFAWRSLLELDPDRPELRRIAFNRLNDKGAGRTIYLPQLLAWAADDPKLTDQLESHVLAALADADPEAYWRLAAGIVHLDVAGHRFANVLIDQFFTNRISIASEIPGDEWSPGYRFPSWFENYVQAAGPDCVTLLAELNTAAASKSNRFRFDDARVHTQLSGDPQMERELLENHLDDARPELRKTKLRRYRHLVVDREQTAAFLLDRLEDPDAQVRRHALIEFATLGDPGRRHLKKFDEMIANDSSPIVRWQAQRTANQLRGLDPEAAVDPQSNPAGATEK